MKVCTLFLFCFAIFSVLPQHIFIVFKRDVRRSFFCRYPAELGDFLYLPVRFAADVFGCKVDDIFHDVRLRGVSDDSAKVGIKRDREAGLLADLAQGGLAFGLIALHMAFRKRPMTAVYMADEQNFASVFGLPRNDRAAGNFFFQKMTSLQFAAENRRR